MGRHPFASPDPSLVPLRTKHEGPANELSRLACRSGSDRAPLDYFDQPADTRAR